MRDAARATPTSVVIGTAGHIDHGKSSLVLALTGTDPDRLKEEKARGITIDLGFAHASVGNVDLAFVDVPGHERFVKNMLAGVGGIDAVLLVVAADESVMPQTREHFAICRLLRIPCGVIAVTKTDLVDADTLAVTQMEARELVAGSQLADAPIVAVSARTGEGLDALRAALADLAPASAGRPPHGAPRLPIDRVFSMRGFGTVVTGTLTSGTLRADDDLVVLPDGRRVKVRGLQVHGAPETRAEAGRRVAVNLGGVEVSDLARGDTLTIEGGFEVTRRFDARVELLEDARRLRHGGRVRFHQGTAELLARVGLADVTELRAGEGAFARIRLEASAVLARGDRFVLRQYSPPLTIGGGIVLDPQPSRTPIRTAPALARFKRLAASDSDAAMAFVEEARTRGIERAALLRRAGALPAGEVVTVGSALFAAPVVADLEARLLAALDSYHGAHPLADGMPREEARERIFGAAPAALFDEVVQRLGKAGRLAGRDRLALPGRGVTLSDEEGKAQTAIAGVFRAAGLAPPDLAAAAASAQVTGAVADRVAKLLLRQKTLVRIETMLFHAEALDRLKQDVTGLKGSRATVDVAAFKERFGVTRKFAIPLLEWLDRERITRRVGDARVIL
ncbi:MAG TPA: selenocysteine-specific translation elongation factor [Vicinamibacterales bacterium]|jgi:selenocysteine-specific elongation factor